MRADRLWSRLAALGWVAVMVGCHAPGNEPEAVRYGSADERFVSDTYTVANINITYEDEHGQPYTETSERTILAALEAAIKGFRKRG
ncbi:unnamed protein product, partial [Iphiclides podalirius]